MKILLFLLLNITSLSFAQEVEKPKAVFPKDQTLMSLMNKELRLNKWKNFEWKIDEDKTFKIITEFEGELPDIEPLKITVLGADKFKVFGDMVVNFEGLIPMIRQYVSMAKSSGAQPYYTLNSGKLTADQGYSVLAKLHSAEVRVLYFSKPEVKAPEKSPVVIPPASPHKK